MRGIFDLAAAAFAAMLAEGPRPVQTERAEEAEPNVARSYDRPEVRATTGFSMPFKMRSPGTRAKARWKKARRGGRL